MKITVYLGSELGNDTVFMEDARTIGEWIAEEHHTLVYGGSDWGTMGVLANTVMRNGGHVIGIMPQFLVDMGRKHPDIEDMRIVESMPIRRSAMMEEGDAFLAMPGGAGTLEEISEVISSYRLGRIHKPVMLWNAHGFYDALKQQFQVMVDAGFIRQDEVEEIHFVETVEEIGTIMKQFS